MVTNRMGLKRYLGPALATLRKRSRKTTRQVAKEVGCSHTAVSRYENGLREPSTRTLFKYLASVGASLLELHDAIQKLVKAGTTKPDAQDRPADLSTL